MADFSVTILGNNSAVPAHGRHPTAQYITIGNQTILMDCGEGTQTRIANHPDTKRSKISYIFISHMHGDHWLGLMGLLNTMALNRRTKPIHIFGHKNLLDALRFIFDKMYFTLRFTVKFHMVPQEGKGLIFENEQFKAEFFQLEHRIPCTGYRFTQKNTKLKLNLEEVSKHSLPIKQWSLIQQGKDGIAKDGTIIPNKLLTLPQTEPKSYSYCSDTRYTSSFLEAIQDSTYAYIETTYTENEAHLAYDRFHATAKEAARMAQAANVENLLIGHFSSRYKDVSIFERQAREIFPNTEIAKEGKTFYF